MVALRYKARYCRKAGPEQACERSRVKMELKKLIYTVEDGIAVITMFPAVST